MTLVINGITSTAGHNIIETEQYSLDRINLIM